MEIYSPGSSFLDKLKLYGPELASAVKEGAIEGVKEGIKQGAFSVLNPRGKSAYSRTNSIANLAQATGNIDELIKNNIRSRSRSSTPFLNSLGLKRINRQSPTQIKMKPLFNPHIYSQQQKSKLTPTINFRSIGQNSPITPTGSPKRNRTNSNASTILLNSPIEIGNEYENYSEKNRGISPALWNNVLSEININQENNRKNVQKMMGGKTRKRRRYRKNTRKVRRN